MSEIKPQYEIQTPGINKIPVNKDVPNQSEAEAPQTTNNEQDSFNHVNSHNYVGKDKDKAARSTLKAGGIDAWTEIEMIGGMDISRIDAAYRELLTIEPQEAAQKLLEYGDRDSLENIYVSDFYGDYSQPVRGHVKAGLKQLSNEDFATKYLDTIRMVEQNSKSK